MLAPNTILQDRYRVVRLLGKGGMGAVYEAIDQRVSCVVALKQTLVGSNSPEKKAFKREAGLLANLRHPVLPKVTDYFVEGEDEAESEFLVMEHIPGYDLAEMLHMRGVPFPQDDVLRWAHQLLDVLEYLHKHQPPIVHRDIKPANLKLTRRGEIFLLDFGLAKGATGQMSTLRTSKSLRGYTLNYSPKEQFTGRTYPQSDIYSLGATLYYLLTKTAPIDAPTRDDAIEAGDPDPLILIEKLNRAISPRIAGVVYRAMAINRRNRYDSAPEMGQALDLAVKEDERGAAEEEYRRVSERQRLQQQRTINDASSPPYQHVEPDNGEVSAYSEPYDPSRSQQDGTNASKATFQRTREAESRNTPVPTITAPLSLPGAPPGTHGETAILVSEPTPFDPSSMTGTSAGRQTDLNSTYAVEFGVGVRRLLNFVLKRRTVAIAIVVLGTVAVGLVVEKMRNRSSGPTVAPTLLKTSPTANKASGPSAPLGMVYVPGGTFIMGREAKNGGDEYERPAHRVTVKPFFIDVYEVTREEYKNCLDQGKCPAPASWINGTYPEGTGHEPVTDVDWYAAIAYAKSVDKRLPTEEEWEFAARGTDGRRYPWGNEWHDGNANANGVSKGMVDVGAFKGASALGTLDMVGNAWEWTSSDWSAYPGGRAPIRSYNKPKVIRGGGYDAPPNIATTTYRRGWPSFAAKDGYGNTGFRCAKHIDEF